MKYIAVAALVALLAVPSTTFADAAVPAQLSLDRAIELALENNGLFVVLREDVRQAAARIELERAAFIPRLVAGVDGVYGHDPGTALTFEGKDRQLGGAFGLAGRLKTGLDYRLELRTRFEDLDGAPSYNPFFSSALQLDLSQPILRNAGFTFNEAQIVIASLGHDASMLLQRARAERLIAEVEVAYWTLLLSRIELDIRKEAVRLAEQQVELSKKRLKLGAIAPIDALEAQSAVARRQEQIPIIKQDISEAEGRLLTLLQAPGTGPEPGVVSFELTTMPSAVALAGSLADSLAAAEKQRPDLAAAELDVQASEVAAEVARNLLRPALDVVASAALTGASGTFVQPATGRDPDLEGGFIDQYRNLHYPRAFLGLRFEVPLDNAAAESELVIREAEVVKNKALVDTLRFQVRNEVKVAFEQLLADGERIRTTQETVAIAEKLLEGQKKMFNEGVGVSFDVFRASSAVIRARIAHIRAEVRARISEARLAFARGAYLEARKVKLAPSPAAVP